MGARRVAIALVLPLVLLYSGRTFARNLDWKDDKTFWAKTIEDAPRCSRAHRNLAFHLFQEGRRDEAFAAMRRSMEIEPNSGHRTSTSRSCSSSRASPRRRSRTTRRRRSTTSSRSQAPMNLGILYGRLGSSTSRRTQFRKLLSLDPGDGSVGSTWA